MARLRLLCALVLAIAGFGIAPPALAQNITATDPEGIAQVVRDKGFDAELTRDGDGDPMILATGKGYRFVIFFYGCTAGQDCTTLGLKANWTDSSADIQKINEWNRENRFGRAYIDKDNDPVVEMDIDLDDGGMSPLLFEDHVEYWMAVMSNYSKFVLD